MWMDDPADCTAECNTRGLKLQQETMDPVASHLCGTGPADIPGCSKQHGPEA